MRKMIIKDYAEGYGVPSIYRPKREKGGQGIKKPPLIKGKKKEK